MILEVKNILVVQLSFKLGLFMLCPVNEERIDSVYKKLWMWQKQLNSTTTKQKTLILFSTWKVFRPLGVSKCSSKCKACQQFHMPRVYTTLNESHRNWSGLKSFLKLIPYIRQREIPNHIICIFSWVRSPRTFFELVQLFGFDLICFILCTYDYHFSGYLQRFVYALFYLLLCHKCVINSAIA